MNVTIFETVLDSDVGALGSAPLSLFCECSRASCEARLHVTAENYLAKLAAPDRFIVHEEHTGDRDEVLATYDGHALVQRVGATAGVR
jgi:hypothetical protein